MIEAAEETRVFIRRLKKLGVLGTVFPRRSLLPSLGVLCCLPSAFFAAFPRRSLFPLLGVVCDIRGPEF